MKVYMIIFFGLAIAIDIIYSHVKSKKRYETKDTVENAGIGLLSLLFDHFFSLISMPLLFLVYGVKIINWHSGLVYYIVLFVIIDFIEYWFHRLSHKIPLMWTGHKVHHQSHKFNFSVGLRTSLLIPFFNIPFYLVIPLLGFHPTDAVLVIFIQGFFQLFVHTESIGSLGVLDKLIVTPSVHRVHHGINDLYLDKNFGKFFTVWDLLFGTYQKETIPVIYGATDSGMETGILKSQFIPFKKWWNKKCAK